MMMKRGMVILSLKIVLFIDDDEEGDGDPEFENIVFVHR
jgi:hypothetical protein